jgi:D-arabinose 1-dehydrogenase-like Zn-dependent alcohol dehydrogenase
MIGFDKVSRYSTNFDIVKGILGNSRTMLERAVDLVETHDLHPYIGHVYEWEDAPKAFEQLRRQDFAGKLVVKV